MYQLLSLGLATAFATAAAAADPPNVVLVMADDQGWGDMAYNGHPHLKTPHFDALAREGLRFDRFYAAAPVCSPTRGSVMTGRHPNRFGCFQWGHPLRPQEVTIAEALKQAGYRTGHFGKWHLGSVQTGQPGQPRRQRLRRVGVVAQLLRPRPDPQRPGQGRPVPGRQLRRHRRRRAEVHPRLRREEAAVPRGRLVRLAARPAPGAARRTASPTPTARPPQQHFYGEITAMDRAFGQLRGELTRPRPARQHAPLVLQRQRRAAEGRLVRRPARPQGAIYEGGLLVPACSSGRPG